MEGALAADQLLLGLSAESRFALKMALSKPSSDLDGSYQHPGIVAQ